MAKDKRDKTPAAMEPAFGAPVSEPLSTASEVGFDFPSAPLRTPVSVGVQAVRRTESTSATVGLRVAAFDAAEACELFGRAGKGGGAAFERWAAAQGVKPGARLTAEEWRPLLEQFAARPLHGHRRTEIGGNHRPNRQHLR